MSFVDPDSLPSKAPAVTFVDPDEAGGFIDPDEGPSVWESVKSFPSRMAKSLPLAAANVKLYANRVDQDNQWLDKPEYQAYIAQTPRAAALKAEREQDKAAHEEARLNRNLHAAEMGRLRPKGAENSFFDRVVGGAAESILPSTAGLATYAATRSPGAAMAVGLGANYPLEAAGTYGEALQEGATEEQATRSAGIVGAVSTALEAPGLGALMEVGKLGKKLAKVGAAEFTQEAVTQGTQDLESNISGYTDISAGDMLQRSFEAGLSGVVMGGAMAPAAQGIQYVHEKADGTKEPVALDIPELDAKVAVEELDALMGKIKEDYRPDESIPDLTPEQAAEADARMAQLAKGIEVEAAPTGPAMVQVLDELFKDNPEANPDIGGMSQEVMDRRVGEEGPSPVPHSQRIFDSSTDARMDGLTPMQVGFLSPGVVTGLIARNDERNYPSGMRRATTDTVQQWVRKYMPNARVIINFDSLGDTSTFGAYQRAVDTKGNIIHVITPREMPSLKYQGGGNSQTRMESLTSLSHEFGHGLAEEAFFEGLRSRVGDEVKNTIQSITKLGTATPEQLSALAEVAPLEVGLVQEWLDTKARIESGEMTAKEWLDTWAGTRKHGAGIKKENTQNMDPYEWARKRVPQGKTLEGSSAKDLILAAFPGGLDYVLSFDEYFAEQMSRAAYAKGDLASSPLNKFFNDIIGKLRDFFRLLKKEGVVAPGTKFNDWLDDLVAKNAAMKRRPRGTQKLSKAVQAKQAELREQARKNLGLDDQTERVEELAEEIIEEFAEVPPPKEELATGLEPKVLMNQELDKMIADGVVEEDNLTVKSIRHRIKIGAFEEAREKMRALQDDLMYDREYTTRAIQRLPNKAQIKLETIKALMGQQTLRKQDREQLELLYNAAQETGVTTIPAEEVPLYILDRALPLKFRMATQYDFSYNEYGWGAADENPASAKTWAVVSPGVRVSRERAMGDKYFRDHWKDYPDVLAHVRLNAPADLPGTVILGEMQSDLMAKSNQIFEPIEAEYDPEYDPAKRDVNFKKLDELQSRWHERVLQETIGRVAELGFKSLYIPLRSAVMALQGFNERSLRIEQFDPNIDPGPGINPVTHEVLVREHNEGVKARQATIDFYEKTLQGFLKAEKYKMKKVERNGLDYLEVDLTDKRSSLVVHWDRENPASPNIPLAHTQESAGVEQESQIDDAIQAFEAEGVQSIFFKRWLGQSKLLNAATGEPLKYWYKTGQVELVGDTPVYRLSSNWRNAAWGVQDIRDVRDYYVKMENPMRVEYPHHGLNPSDMQSLVQQAQAGGFDGIVLKNTGMPFEDTQVLVWAEDQLADGQLGGNMEKVYYDLESPVQAQAHSTVTGPIKEFLSAPWAAGVAVAAKAFDALVQMQQRAVVPLYGNEFDLPLQGMVSVVNKAETFKNQLQVDGEKVVKEILSLGIAKQNLIDGFLSAEWKGGEHWTALAEDRNGRLVFQQSELFRKQLIVHGIDPQTQEGQELAQLILDYKNAALLQFEAQKQILLELAVSKYEGNDLIIARVHQKIKATFDKLYTSPFMPQGHFGNYVVIVKESKKKNGKHYRPVHVEHFESEASFKKASEYWLQKQDENPRQYKVSTKEVKDFEGIPVNLPVSLLQNFQDTGLFSEEQLSAAAELMQPDMVDKIAKRFDDASSKLDGASKDFVRNYADFIWHNANFTWKLRYRNAFTKMIQWQQYEIREMHKSQGLPASDRVKIIALRNRNLKMMENTKNYLLYPTSEFQGVRLWVTLLMLAYNFKTALLNFSTMLNTGAAMTTEYGELKGTRYMLGAMNDLARYKIDTASWMDEPKDNAEILRRRAFSSVMDDAIRDGVIDQSYAYFLAGQSTSSAMLRHFRRTNMGHMARQFVETGMWTFRTVEKLNRAMTLMSFFNAEFDRLRAGGMKFDAARVQAYETAKSKTLLLQNAYDAGNRSEFLRGKKAVLFIFMSYVQFMGWIMSGGYERGQRAQFRAEGRAVRPWVFGTTAKLWLMFLMLSGLEGLPFGSNILDILQAIWRKLSGGENVRLEMRKFFQEYGIDSQLVMHGLLHNAGGLNLSGSFGLGQIVPGTEMLNRDFEDAGSLIGKGVMEVSGPAGGIVEDIIKVGALVPKVMSGRATVPEMMKELPGATGAVGRALDAHLKQTLRPTYGVTTKSGARLTQDLETGEFRDLSDYELAAMALGGNPAVLAENRERNFSKTGEIIYWRTRRAGLLETYRKSVAEKDLEKRKASQAAIDEYNEQVPNFKMKITVRDRFNTVKDMKKRNRKLERGQSTEKRYNAVVKEVDEAF